MEWVSRFVEYIGQFEFWERLAYMWLSLSKKKVPKKNVAKKARIPQWTLQQDAHPL